MIRRFVLLAFLVLAGCHHNLSAQDTNVRGLIPKLAFNMTDARTGKPVNAGNFNGKVTLLFFGYTHCPDECPVTMYNLTRVFKIMGPLAAGIQVLFVTVDPTRDTAAVLNRYTALFGPNFIGLRGNANQLYKLARRYRVVFTVVKKPVYSVTHSAAVYVFNAQGRPRFIIAGLDTTRADIQGTAADLSAVARE